MIIDAMKKFLIMLAAVAAVFQAVAYAQESNSEHILTPAAPASPRINGA